MFDSAQRVLYTTLHFQINDMFTLCAVVGSVCPSLCVISVVVILSSVSVVVVFSSVMVVLTSALFVVIFSMVLLMIMFSFSQFIMR